MSNLCHVKVQHSHLGYALGRNVKKKEEVKKRWFQNDPVIFLKNRDDHRQIGTCIIIAFRSHGIADLCHYVYNLILYDITMIS